MQTRRRRASALALSTLVLWPAISGSAPRAEDGAPGAVPREATAPVDAASPPAPPSLPAQPAVSPPSPATAPALLPVEPVPATRSAASPPPAPPAPSSDTQPQPRVGLDLPSSAPGSLTEPSATQQSISESAPQNNHVGDVTVTADLDRERNQIAPNLGATAYTIGPKQIAATPQGENANFSQVILRSPSVVQDSFGQFHVRGEHNNLTYRVNGVLLPEGLNGFGQELDTRLINSVTLITGSLPSQFGFRTAGIIDVTTKSGATLNHNEFSLYGGSYDTVQPSLQIGGTDQNLDYFAVASYNHNNLGIENDTSSSDPIHDQTNQEKLFSYLSYHIDDTSRLSLFFNLSYSDFQLPAPPGVPPAFALAGHPRVDSATTNENQNEQDYYAVISYQKTEGDISFLASGFTRWGQIRFVGDPVNDLVFTGVSSRERNIFFTNGIQFDLSDRLDDQHTLRAGVLADFTAERLITANSVFPAVGGAQTSNIPFSIPDNSGNTAIEAGIYLQDEWRITNQLTLNYGLRYDRFDASFEDEGQLSPRVSMVYRIDDPTSFHLGYSRYFAPPTPQFVQQQTLLKFANTTNEPSTFRDDATKVEQSHYFDVGLSRQLSPEWQVSVDGYYKDAKHLNDLGQFGTAIILSPFAYRSGHVYGAEVSSTYSMGGLSLFGNFAYSETDGRQFESSQFLFGPDEQAYSNSQDIHLDHQSTYSGSAGASYAWKDNLVYVDVLYGSGLRSGFANTQKQPSYIPVNAGYEHTFHPELRGLTDVRFRFDVLNLFDQVYALRDGSGIGVGAPQFGPRRAFYAGLTFDF